MAKRPLIIDCDPGQDDAIALMVAFAAPDLFNLRGITTVAGNVSLALTSANARRVRDLVRDPALRTVPIHAGCPRPLIEPLATAEHVHGRTGIDGADLPEPVGELADGHAVDFLIKTLRSAREPVTLATLGPLTNIAVALTMAPDIADSIAELVMMGGSTGAGNVTPVAEFNIRTDPHAAAMVFAAGLDITMFGLNLTHQVRAGAREIARLQALGTPAGVAVAGMLDFYADHRRRAATASGDREMPQRGAPLHDPCVIAHLVDPGLFEGERADVRVETASTLTIGQTVCDFNAAKPNARVMTRARTDAALDLIIDHVGRI